MSSCAPISHLMSSCGPEIGIERRLCIWILIRKCNALIICSSAMSGIANDCRFRRGITHQNLAAIPDSMNGPVMMLLYTPGWIPPMNEAVRQGMSYEPAVFRSTQCLFPSIAESQNASSPLLTDLYCPMDRKNPAASSRRTMSPRGFSLIILTIASTVGSVVTSRWAGSSSSGIGNVNSNCFNTSSQNPSVADFIPPLGTINKANAANASGQPSYTTTRAEAPTTPRNDTSKGTAIEAGSTALRRTWSSTASRMIVGNAWIGYSPLDPQSEVLAGET